MSEVSIKVGDAIPQGTFTYIPYAPELEDHSACGIRAYPCFLCVAFVRDWRDLTCRCVVAAIWYPYHRPTMPCANLAH